MTPTPGSPTPAHVAVVASTAPSHVHPHLAVVRELVDRGHRVTYLIGDALAELARPTGADVIGCSSVLPGVGGPRDEWPSDAVEGMRLFLDEQIHVLPQVRAALDGDRPDVVLYDIGGYAGAVAASRWGVPAVQLSPTYVAWDGYHDDLAEVMGPLLASPAGVDLTATFDGWLAAESAGLTQDDVNVAPPRSLVLVPKVMQPNAERVDPDRYRFVGPCLDPARFEPRGWRPPDGDGPLLYVALGTAYHDRPDVYRACLEAVDGLGWRLVLSRGSQVAEADLGPLPPGVDTYELVPQLAVLAEADVFVTHAGMGSSTEALWSAVPTVAVPQAVDQFDNAAKLEELGVGRHLTTDPPSAADLRAALVELTADGAVRERLDAIAAELHAVGGPGGAADAVEDAVAGTW